MLKRRGTFFYARAWAALAEIGAMPAWLSLALFLACGPAMAAPAPKTKDGAQASKGDAAREEKAARARKALAGSDAWNRLQAAEDLSRGKARLPHPEIESAARKEKNPQVRYTLLQALAVQGGTAAVRALTDALDSDPALIVRVAAAQELGRVAGGDQGAQALSRALAREMDTDVRKACALSLGRYPSPEALKALEALADDPDLELRKHAVLALRKHPKGPEADRILAKLERGPDPSAAGAAKGPKK